MSDHDRTEGAWWWPFVRVLGPAIVATLQVAGTFGASRGQPDREPVDALAVTLLLIGPASLFFLRRFPVPVLVVTAVATLTYLLAGYPYGPGVLSLVISLFVNVLLGHRIAAWVTGAAVFVGHFALGAALGRVPVDEEWSWIPVLAVAAWGLLVLVAGDVVRARRERAQAAQRARAETQRRQANEERLRIARELHDVVAHHMSLINVQAGVALHLLDRKPDQAETALMAIRDASHEALTEMRSLVGVLRDEAEAAPRAPISMLGSVDDLVERTRQTGLEVDRQVEGAPRRLSAAVELATFRILQEAVTNVVRHSGARRVDLLLRYGSNMVTVRVDDDGRGDSGLGSGSGIRGMRERAAALGGSLTVGPSPSGGLRVEATLPTQEQS